MEGERGRKREAEGKSESVRERVRESERAKARERVILIKKIVHFWYFVTNPTCVYAFVSFFPHHKAVLTHFLIELITY